jgi:type III restriction enzyme
LVEQLNQGKVLVRNWQAMQWDNEERLKKRKSVDKRGAKSDEAYAREVLGELEKARNILVLNDEAHHAWRVGRDRPEGVDKEAVEEATKWIGALDRIHKARGVLRCLDFTATPFVPTGRQSVEELLFPWIVSDFGLNDAIESGLVKTPRVVVRDDSQLTPENKSSFYHLYADPGVKTDLNVKGEPERPLPDLLLQAYRFLTLDWRRTYEAWKRDGSKVPPVLITVCNTTFTAARVKYAFDTKRFPEVPELSEADHLLHIDARVLAEAEAGDLEEAEETAKVSAEEGEEENGDGAPVRKRSKKQRAEDLRKTVDTVGKEGKPGEQIRNVISVAMLSEGWDAKTVTHIMGLRAFSSQLLCEQVVGRGLRRTNYDIDEETKLYRPD